MSMAEIAKKNALLRTRALHKEFNGFVAVTSLDLCINEGTIHALIGPNGAGKSTVFNLLTKFVAPTSGKIYFRGEDITVDDPAGIARRGIARSFQISAIFPHLTVRDNVRIALQRRLRGSFHFWRSDNSLNVLNDEAEYLLEAVGLANLHRSRAASLPYGQKRALEIATTLALDPTILLLDEPMAGLGREDIGRISKLILTVGAKRTVLMVEHNLSIVAELSDTITVLARGGIIAEGAYDDVSMLPAVREAYMGIGHA